MHRAFRAMQRAGKNGVVVDARTSWTERTAADLMSVLLELVRVLKGLSFYDEADPNLTGLLDRAYRAVASELERAGTIDLSLEETGFRVAGLDEDVPLTGVLLTLEGALRSHQLERIRIDPTLTREALHALLDLLGRSQTRFATPEAFAQALAARDSTGIELNGLSGSVVEVRPRLAATPPRASASLGSALLRGAPELETDAPAVASEMHTPEEDEKATLDAAPLAAPPGDDRGERLRARLIELDQTVDDEIYAVLARDVAGWAAELFEEGLHDECYRAILVFADHAVGSGGRSEAQARTADDCFRNLAIAGPLDDLITRAAQVVDGTGIRAAQLLLQLGEESAPAIFDQIAASDAPEAVSPLGSLILTLGEAALPTLLAAIEGPDETRARLGIRIAGELQSPLALPSLVKAIAARDPGLRLEAIRALTLLPGTDSKTALETALASDVDEIVVAATEALANIGGHEAAPALLDVLEASLHTSRTQVSRELIEVLGRLGDERAVPRLGSILERRPVLRRAHWHAIQLAAVDALAVLSSKEARRCLERTARSGPRPLRSRARSLLERGLA